MNINVIDFFCGCGGSSAGLEKSGMNIIAGIDIDKNALETFKHNFKSAEIFSQNIRDLIPEDLCEVIGTNKSSKLLFAVCAPCQPFSTQNRLKDSDDERISLLAEFHRFVEYFEPDYIILENVPGIQRVDNGPFTNFIVFIEAKGYKVDFQVLNAMDYGVPQSRKRLVLIATKNGTIELPTSTHGKTKDKLNYITVKDAIAKYPKLDAGDNSDKSHKYPNHVCANMQEITLKRLKATPEGGDRRDWPKSLWLECHKNHNGHNDVYGRLSWDKPSVTLTTKCVSISNGRFGHPDQLRALSVREAAALQSFDDSFKFIGNMRDAAKQVGNAVPVLFAKALGDQVVSHMRGE